MLKLVVNVRSNVGSTILKIVPRDAFKLWRQLLVILVSRVVHFLFLWCYFNLRGDVYLSFIHVIFHLLCKLRLWTF